MTFTEAILRDNLLGRLDLIERGLTLVKKEFYLANQIGTGGFVDIMARDKNGCLVVIEIKISKYSEREAITELFKYISLLKQNMALKDSEIRVVVVSTDWTELFLPFSEFYWGCHFNSQGFKAQVDSNGIPISLQPISLPERNIGRCLLPRHWLQIYREKDERDASSSEYAKVIQGRGIHNFILLFFNFDYLGPEWFGFYFAQQKQPLDFFKKIAKTLGDERYEEVVEATEDFPADDLLNEFADAAIESANIPADEVAIGHPEKIKGYLENGRWKVERIERFGTFLSDIRLTDQQIIHDLCGFSGGSHAWFFSGWSLQNKSMHQEILDNYGNCLYYNDSWRQNLRDYLEYSRAEFSNAKFLLNIFSSDNILETIALFTLKGDINFLPNFKFIISIDEKETLIEFSGQVFSTGTKPKGIDQIVTSHFKGDIYNIVFFEFLHAVSPINNQLMSELGLIYGTTFRKSVKGKIIEEFFNPIIRGNSVIPGVKPGWDSFFNWLLLFPQISSELAEIYKKHVWNVLEEKK